jgi:predicted secreted protein
VAIKRKLVAALALFALSSFMLCAACWAGDVANFKDLGFTADGGIYMFGEYGVTGNDLKPWARLYIVDVTKNDFVAGGRLVYKDSKKIVAGTDGEGALYAIVGQNPEITSRYHFNYLKQGIPLFVTLKNSTLASEGSDTQTIDFRDFDRKTAYTVTLNSLVQGSGSGVSSSFYLTIQRKNPNGTVESFQAGSPDIKRGVSSYSIKKVTYKPDTHSMVFVIETRSPSKTGGDDIGYMVETWKE